MVTNGATAQSTSSDTAITMIAAQTDGLNFGGGFIQNGGTVDGEYSLDGGTAWIAIPAATSLPLPRGAYASGIKARRIPSGSNVTGLIAQLWYGAEVGVNS